MNNIVQHNDASINNELHWLNGRGYVSQSGLARLTGVSETAIRKLLSVRTNVHLKESQVLTPSGLRSSNLILDVDAASIIKHYAYKGKEQAQLTLDAFIAVGMRAWIKDQLGIDDAQPQLTREQQIAQALLLSQEIVEELKAENAQLKPAAQNWETFCNEGDSIDVEKFAKAFGVPGIGRNKMFTLLREMGYIQGESSLPYQRYLNQGLFDVVEVNKQCGNKVKTFAKTLITPKGQQRLAAEIRAHLGMLG